MAMAVQIEAILTVPVADNDGAAFTTDEWVELHVRLGQVSGGATRRGPQQGTWTDPATGELFEEPVFEFEVGLESWFDLPAFLDVVVWTQSHFRQIAVRFKVAGIAENYGL